MTKLRKMISCTLTLAMILSICNIVSATETATIQWNNSAVSTETTQIYEDFPVQLDKHVDNAANMTISFQYLKVLSGAEEAEVAVMDFGTKEVVFTADFSEEKYVYWENVGNDKTYGVFVSETANGSTTNHAAMLKTFYQETDFPVSFLMDDFQVNGEISAEAETIMLREAGLVVECEHEEYEECVPQCSPKYYTQHIAQADFNTFYNTLAPNKLYEIQTNAVVEGIPQNYGGFISTYENGKELGVFTRGYNISEMPANELQNKIATGNMEIPPRAPSELNSDANAGTSFFDPIEYVRYENLYYYLDDITEYLYIVWTIPEYGNYTVETIGNVDTMISYYSEPNTGSIISTWRTGGTGENASFEIEAMGGVTRYFRVRVQSGNGGEFAFRIIRDDEADDQTNYRDVAQTNYQNGNYDENENPSAYLDYGGDVDIYVLQTTTGKSWIELMNIDSSDIELPEEDGKGAGIGPRLSVDVYTVEGTQTNGFDLLWRETALCKFVTSDVNLSEMQTGYSAGTTYFEIKQDDITNNTNDDGYGYVFNFYPANYKDDLEAEAHATYGNIPAYPTMLTLPVSGLEATLHKGDSDWFKFNSGEGGAADISIRYISTQQDTPYNLTLYPASNIIVDTSQSSPSWTVGASVGTVSDTSQGKKIEYILEANTDYMISVTRPDSSTYSAYPGNSYLLTVSIAQPSTATLNGNVTLTHTVGETITSLDDFLATVMDKLTCKDGSAVIEDSVAVNDVVLYYNNSALTVETVNGMSAGNYNIVVKYKDVEATGGTITLNVTSPATGVIIELTNVTMEPVTNPVWDWAACAKMIANARLSREGLSATTQTVPMSIVAVKGTGGIGIRGTVSETALAANYFYTNGNKDSFNFYDSAIDANGIENALKESLEDGKASVILLTSATAPTDYSGARYVVLCGINTITHEYKIMDPVSGTTSWVAESVLLNGGYNSNNDLRFTGLVVEFI